MGKKAIGEMLKSALRYEREGRGFQDGHGRTLFELKT
jgi:hypothetical protein